VLALSSGGSRVARSLAAIVSGKVILAAGSVLLVPLFLARWSQTYYGEWLALASMTAYLSTFDFGMSMGAVNRLTQAYARADLDDYRTSQDSGFAFYLGIATAGTLLLTIGVLTLPIGRWAGLVEMDGADAAWTVLVLGLVILWALPSGFMTATYRTTGDLATCQWIGNVQQVGSMALVGVALFRGAHVTTVALVQAAPLVAVTAYAWWDLRRRHPSLLPGLRRARVSTLRELLKPSGLFVLITAANVLSLQGVVLIIASFLGGAAVAGYVTCRTLANIIRQFVNTAVIAVWPEITRLDARGHVTGLRLAHSTLVVLSATVCISVAAAVWYEGEEMIFVWTRHALRADAVVLHLLLVLLVLQSPWLVSSVFTAAANRHRVLALCLMMSSLVGIGLAGMFVQAWGVAGAVAGIILADVVTCSHFVIQDSCRSVGQPYLPFIRRLWPCLALTALAAMGAGWVAHTSVPGPAVVRWLATLAATTVSSAFIAWAVWFTADERRSTLVYLAPLVRLAGAKA
jgi:O-antigen/teichoic acid export membrane protein